MGCFILDKLLHFYKVLITIKLNEPPPPKKRRIFYEVLGYMNKKEWPFKKINVYFIRQFSEVRGGKKKLKDITVGLRK